MDYLNTASLLNARQPHCYRPHTHVPAGFAPSSTHPYNATHRTALDSRRCHLDSWIGIVCPLPLFFYDIFVKFVFPIHIFSLRPTHTHTFSYNFAVKFLVIFFSRKIIDFLIVIRIFFLVYFIYIFYRHLFRTICSFSPFLSVPSDKIRVFRVLTMFVREKHILICSSR